MTGNQTSHAEGEGFVDDNDDRNSGVMDEDTVQTPPAPNIRPRRELKENVRYSSLEYHLSEVSNNCAKTKLVLSSQYVHPKAGIAKDGGHKEIYVF